MAIDFDTLLNVAKQVCGVTKGTTRLDRKSWMWSEEVKEAVKNKKEKFRKWKNSKKEEDKQKYREARNLTKKTVAIEINKNREEWIRKIEADGKNADGSVLSPLLFITVMEEVTKR